MTRRFSIIVPTHRRPIALAACLDALSRLDHPREALEVVVVEDGEPDPSLSGLRAAPPAGLDVVWASQHHAGPATARNLGARLARHEFLAFTDDDCRPRRDWLGQLSDALDAVPSGVVGGHTVNAVRDNAFSRASQALVTYITAYSVRKGDPFFASNNVAMARATFDALGGFDPSFGLAGGEDRDFCERCAHHDVDRRHAPAAIIEHHHVLTWRRFWDQHHRYGQGAYQYHLKRGAGPGPRSFEPPRFYTDLLLQPFRTTDEPAPLRVSLLLCVSQVANALGYFSARARARARAKGAPAIDPYRGGSTEPDHVPTRME